MRSRARFASTGADASADAANATPTTKGNFASEIRWPNEVSSYFLLTAILHPNQERNICDKLEPCVKAFVLKTEYNSTGDIVGGRKLYE